MVRHLQIPGQIWDLLIVFLSTWQYALVLTDPLLEYPNQQAPHLEGQFYTHIRKFLSHIGGSLEIHNICSRPLERTNDQRIMDIVCASTLTDAEIRRVRYCSHYLQVHTISDLCNAAGSRILPTVFNGTGSIRQSSS